MPRRVAAGLILASLLFVTKANAQQLTQTQASNLRAELRAGNVTAATALVEQQCGAEFIASRDETSKVSERAAKARDALQCARVIAASVVALADPEQVPQVRALLDAWLSTYERNHQERESESEFLGLRWSLGVGASRAFDPSISEAVIVNDTVRQVSDIREQPRALFEYHKLFWCNKEVQSAREGADPLSPFLRLRTSFCLASRLGFSTAGKQRLRRQKDSPSASVRS